MGGRTSPGELLRWIDEVAMRHTSEECLPWPFGKDVDGYGRVWVDGKLVGASRYVCELAHGAPPTPKHHAAHSCGKGHEGCIAPGHISWKTPKENNADKLEHGTHNRGQRNRQAKLTEDAARIILSLKGDVHPMKLAERYGVSRGAIDNVQSGRTWFWITEAFEERKS